MGKGKKCRILADKERIPMSNELTDIIRKSPKVSKEWTDAIAKPKQRRKKPQGSSFVEDFVEWISDPENRKRYREWAKQFDSSIK